MLDYIARKLGYVHKSSLETVIVKYSGRIKSQRETIDRLAVELSKARERVEDLRETCQILRRDYCE